MKLMKWNEWFFKSMKFRRWKIWIVNIFDCFFSVQPMYHAQEVTWKTWTNDIKCLLLKSLFNEHSLNGNDSGPSHQSVSLIFSMYNTHITNKRTDVWSRDFVIWKVDSGQWSRRDCEIELWATFEAPFLKFLCTKNWFKFWEPFRI